MDKNELVLTQTLICATENGRYVFMPSLEVYGLKKAIGCTFSITAKHKESCRASQVTNNNFICSEIVLAVLDPDGNGRFTLADTWLDTTLEIGLQLMQMSVKALSDPKAFVHFEEAMDDDRDAGEWEDCIRDPIPFPDQ